MPPFLSCDYTHRLNFEKYNVCVMGTTDPSQSFHFIAFAISSDESDKTHTYIFETVRAEVEAIVARRTAARQDILRAADKVCIITLLLRGSISARVGVLTVLRVQPGAAEAEVQLTKCRGRAGHASHNRRIPRSESMPSLGQRSECA
jgi:hypothetical protein